MDNYRFLISGGGTGGHIYPAIAIANELKRRHPTAKFLFVGAKDKMEMEKVPQAGYSIKGLWISGLHRKLTLRNILFPIKLISSLIKASNIVTKFKPHAVIGTGGFASGPVLKVASGRAIPCVLQEQNSYAGMTNKLLKNKVSKICVAYDGMEAFFPADKIVKTGNPVRGDLVQIGTNKEEALAYFGLGSNSRQTLLILGGSLGARRINQLILDHLELFEKLELQLIWQCGKLYSDTYEKYESETVKVRGFMDRMDHAYTAADLIISRSGAGAVSELCIVGKPVLFIPSPNVAENHQAKNALALVNEKAAVAIEEKELDANFEKVFTALFQSKSQKEELAAQIKKLALPGATSHIVDEIEKLLED